MGEKVIVDWQLGMKVMQRMEHLLKNPDFLGDVIFEVWKRDEEAEAAGVGSAPTESVFKAHRFILATGSPVFHTMFYGSLPPKTDEIDDIEPEAFGHLLRFLYTDEFSSAINLDNALDVVYAAKKYGVDRLVASCEELLISRIPRDPVNTVVPYFCMKAAFFDLPRLEKHCWDLIDDGGPWMMWADNILETDVTTMEKIIERKTLRVREVHVFEAAERWAVHHDNLEALKRWLTNGSISITAMNREEIGKVLDGPSGVGRQLLENELIGTYRNLYHSSANFTTVIHKRTAPVVSAKAVGVKVKLGKKCAAEECLYHQALTIIPCGTPLYFFGCTIHVGGHPQESGSYVVTFVMKNRGSNVFKSDSVVVSNNASSNGQLKVLLKDPWLCLGTWDKSPEHTLIIQISKRPWQVYKLQDLDWSVERGCRVRVNKCSSEEPVSILCPGSALGSDRNNQSCLLHNYGFVTGLHFEDT